MFTAQSQSFNKKSAILDPDIQDIKKEQLDLWQADRATWHQHHPLIAMLASGLTLVPVFDDFLATATTDGRSLFFNVAYSAGLNATTRSFLQAHLVWHCVAGHLRENPHLDSHRWHLACDHEVNSLLMLQGFPLCEDTVLFPSRLKQPASAVYDWLGEHPALDREVSFDQLPYLPFASSSLPDAWQLTADPAYRPQPLSGQVENWWQRHALYTGQLYKDHANYSAPIIKFLLTSRVTCA